MEFIYDNRGEGYSKGLELFLQKKQKEGGKLDGWISYTLAKTQKNLHRLFHRYELLDF